MSGESDGRDLLPWLRGGTAWSHNGRESGSTTYEPWNVSTALAVLHHARNRGHDELASASARWLRALWAKYVLCATPWLPPQTRFRQHDRNHDHRRLDYTGYRGPMVHMAGNRQAENPRRGSHTGAWIDVHAGHPALAWAADWPGRRYKREFIQPGARGGTLWTVHRLTGKGFGQTVDPSVFGLTADERRTLAGFLNAPTDLGLARRVGAWLDGYPNWKRTVLTIRRYGSGAVLTVLSRTSNANKSGAVITLGTREASTWLLPSAYRGVGAATAEGSIQGTTAVATSNDGGRLSLDLSGLGEVAWEARWTGDGLVFDGAQTEPEPRAIASTGSQPRPDASLVAVLHALDAWASAQPSDVESVLRTAGELFVRLDTWTDRPDHDREPARASVAQAAHRLQSLVSELPR